MSRKLIALAALALGACSPGYSYRYRVTVEVDTPQGLKTGSSVWEVSVREGSGIPDSGLRASERGSAVAVELPTGTLYALMKRHDYFENQRGNYVTGVMASYLNRVDYPGATKDLAWPDDVKQIIRLKPVFEQDIDHYPLLVRFTDEKQAATVQKVDPANLAASFGPGVSLKRITVTYTSDRPDVHALDERLPWIPTTAALLKPAFRTPMSQWTFGSFIIGSDFEQDQK